ncbi:MAG TPA: diacylglycerol kinase family protein [Micromonosporaceae bacterium]|jgi:YegS/Rv2252/BmrU family lipid kinase|nr:diacylglycerol kinase family protein [Micromonosporaceae bacterium]
MRSFTVLVNPISGDGRAPQRARPVAALLRSAGATVREVVTQSANHATQAARAAARAGDVVVAAGGDGLARDVADAVAPTDGVMGILPAGRGNDFARKVGIPTEPTALANLLLHGESRKVDVLECGGRIIPGNLYVGIDSTANAMINARRWVPAPLLYRLAPILTMLRWHPVDFRLTIDGVPRSVRAHTVVVGNSGTYGHGLDIVPSALVDDGMFDVLVADDMPRWKIAAVIREATEGRHVHRPEISVLTAREITIEAARRVPVCADGDYLGELPVTVRLLPAALNMLRP